MPSPIDLGIIPSPRDRTESVTDELIEDLKNLAYEVANDCLPTPTPVATPVAILNPPCMKSYVEVVGKPKPRPIDFAEVFALATTPIVPIIKPRDIKYVRSRGFPSGITVVLHDEEECLLVRDTVFKLLPKSAQTIAVMNESSDFVIRRDDSKDRCIRYPQCDTYKLIKCDFAFFLKKVKNYKRSKYQEK